MNFIDVLLLITIIISIASAYQKGFLLSATDLICWLGSLLLAFFGNPALSQLLEHAFPSAANWSKPFAFIFSALLFKILLDLGAGSLHRYIPVYIHRSRTNLFLGVIPGFVNGLLWAAFVATMLLLFPLNSRIPDHVRESKLAGPLASEISWLGQKFRTVFSDDRNFIKNPPHVGAEETIKLPFKVADSNPNSRLEAEMLILINKERRTVGLEALMADPEMRVVARKHSADMFSKGYFSHTNLEGMDPFDRMAQEEVTFLTAGENLALAQSLEIAHKGLMQSPGHRANVLNGTFGRVGIGIQDGGFYGLMITQNFRN